MKMEVLEFQKFLKNICNKKREIKKGKLLKLPLFLFVQFKLYIKNIEYMKIKLIQNRKKVFDYFIVKTKKKFHLKKKLSIVT